jgi:P27 family predicted phage terminase small subunit
MIKFKPAKLPKAPKHLSDSTRKWWSGIVSSFVFDPRDLPMLTAAGEAWDRARQARELLDRDGLTFTSKSGEIKRHPACQIEHDAMIRYARLMRELRLDADSPQESRPPGLRYGGQQ